MSTRPYTSATDVLEGDFVPYDAEAGGAISIEGDIDPEVRIDFENATAMGGVFRQRPGRVEIIWPCTEHAFVVVGAVSITYLDRDETIEYGPGQGWMHSKGERIIWQTSSDPFVKSFFLLLDE